jgi:hypothetical protein
MEYSLKSYGYNREKYLEEKKSEAHLVNKDSNLDTLFSIFLNKDYNSPREKRFYFALLNTIAKEKYGHSIYDEICPPPDLIDTLAFKADTHNPHADLQHITAEAVKEAYDELVTSGFQLILTHCSIEKINGSESLTLGAYSTTISKNIRTGDAVCLASLVILKTDTTGPGELKVIPRLFRKVCSNGIVHFLGDGEEFDIKEIKKENPDPCAVKTRVKDCINHCMRHTDRFELAVKKCQTAASQQISNAGNELFSYIQQYHLHISSPAYSSILRRFMRSGDDTLWGIIGAVTAEAHKVSNITQAVEFERAGGIILYNGVSKNKKLTMMDVKQSIIDQARGQRSYPIHMSHPDTGSHQEIL